MPHQDVAVYAPQVEALAAGEHGYGYLADLRGCKDELGVRRRFLQRLEKRVEGASGEHVDFVDNEDPVAAQRRAVACLADEFTCVVDAGMGGSIDLNDIDMPGFSDAYAGPAGAAGVEGRPVPVLVPDAIQRPSDDSGCRRLADTADAGQHESVRDPLGFEGISKRAHEAFLPDQRIESQGTVLSGQDFVGVGATGSDGLVRGFF